MATALSDIIFAVCAVAIAIAQWLILRSTARGMKHAEGRVDPDARVTASPPNSAFLEWAYAVVPAVALVALLAFSWRAMHPAVIRANGIAPSSIGAEP